MATKALQMRVEEVGAVKPREAGHRCAARPDKVGMAEVDAGEVGQRELRGGDGRGGGTRVHLTGQQAR